MANHRVQRDSTASSILMPLARRAISTRSSQNLQIVDQNVDPNLKRSILAGNNVISNKRKADGSPQKNKTTDKKVKRSALGNLTNASVAQQDENRIKINTKKQDIAHNKKSENDVIKPTATQTVGALTKQHSITNQHVAKPEDKKILGPPIPKPRNSKILTRAAARNAASTKKNNKIPSKPIVAPSEKIGTQCKPKDIHEPVPIKQTRRISNEFEKTEDSSLYVSALDEMSSCFISNATPEIVNLKNVEVQKIETAAPCRVESIKEEEILVKIVETVTPDGVDDFDKENWDDPFQVSHYAMDIFNYLKEREVIVL